MAEVKKIEMNLTHVLSKEEPYYLSGPQQGRPPDGTLRPGTKVRLVRNEGSYSRIQFEVEASIATESLKALNP